MNLFHNIQNIIEVLQQTPAFELSDYWEIQTSEESKISDWIDLVAENSRTIQDAEHIDIKQILALIIN